MYLTLGLTEEESL